MEEKSILPSWLMTSNNDLASSKPGKVVAISIGIRFYFYFTTMTSILEL